VAILLGNITRAGPTTKPAAKPDAAGGGDEQFVISKMRIQQFTPHTYIFAETQTTLQEIGPVVMQIIPKFMETIKDGKVDINGPMVFVYQGVVIDQSKPFNLQVGMLVADGTKDVGDYHVRQLDQFRCATVLYSGAVANIGQAYQQLFTDLFAA